MMDKMLVDYSESSGSALSESNKSSNNLQGSINKLTNSWNEFINSIVNSEGLKAIVNILNSLVQTVTKLTTALGSFGTIGLGVGITATIKNFGKTYKCMVSNTVIVF